jgi:opacity protein-like surface antigen
MEGPFVRSRLSQAVGLALSAALASYPGSSAWADPANGGQLNQEQSAQRTESNSPQMGVQERSGLPPLAEDLTDLREPLPADEPVIDEATGGYQWGSFRVRPKIVINETYNDNIYATLTNEKRDFITTITPTFVAQSEWDRHKLNFFGGLQFDRYNQYTSENTSDYWLGTNGRYDISDTSNIFAGVALYHEHEDRYSPDAVQGAAKPTIYDKIESHAGFAKEFGRLSLRAGATMDKLDFQNVPVLGGTSINMNDRDRNMYSLGTRVSYKVSDQTDLFFQLASDNRRYDSYLDDNGYHRDSDGYRTAVGVKVKPSEDLQADIFGGYLHQNYKDGTLSDVSKPYFGGHLNWNASSATTLTARVDRSIEETVIAGASSYLSSTAAANVKHDISQNMQAHADLSYTQDSFQGINRNDNMIDGGFGLNYYFGGNYFVGADYRLIHRNSNVSYAQYYDNLIMLNIGLDLGEPRAVRTASLGQGIYLASNDTEGLKLPSFESDSDLSGFYLGAQAGAGSMDTDASGPRGTGTVGNAFGGVGGTYGAFAGYGVNFNRWYVGAELEAENNNSEWSHARSTGRLFSLDKNESYSATARAGYTFNGALLYGRLGLARTDFHSNYFNPDYAGGTWFSQDDSKTGVRWGFGSELMVSDNIFVRMDYTSTNYGAYDVSFGSESDRYKNTDSQVNVGVGWRFNNDSAVRMTPTRIDYNGIYMGAQIGHGALNVRNDAIHMDSGVSSNYTADFSGTGVTSGLFAGYGHAFHNIYAALELNVEDSHSSFDKTRENPSGGGGRNWSVDKKGGYGASMRLGYILPSSALLYGRVGVVRTQFNTTYDKGSSASNCCIDRSDTKSGLRYGAGAEIPATENIFWRIDYTYTDYGSYGFTTAQAQPDTANFKNSESLTSLGIGLRF